MIKTSYFLGLLALVQVNICLAQNCLSFLNQSEIRDLAEDGENVWAATGGGLVKIDKTTQELTYFTKANSSIAQNSLDIIKADENGKLWYKTETGLIGSYDNGSFESFDVKDLLNFQGIIRDLEIVNNKLYVAGDDYLCIYDNGSWSKILVDYPERKDSWGILEIEEKDGKIFLNISGINFIDFSLYNDFVCYSNGIFHLIKSFPISNPLANADPSNYFTLDNEGNIWIGRWEGGLIRLDTTSLEITHFIIPQNLRNNCPNVYINEIMYENDRVYAGGAGLQGLFYLDLTTQNFTAINGANSSLSDSDINCLKIASDKEVYTGSESYITQINLENLSSQEMILTRTPYNIKPLSQRLSIIDDQMFVMGPKHSEANDSVKIYDIISGNWETQKGFYSNVTNSIFGPKKVVSDGEGNLWLASSAGLFIKSEQDIWQKYTFNNADTLDFILDILIDQYGNKWLVTQSDGIVRINSDGTIVPVRKIQTSGLYYGLCADADHVYASGGTNEGVLKIDILTNDVTVMNQTISGVSVDFVRNIFMRNDTAYFANGDFMGKIEDDKLMLIFKFTDMPGTDIPQAPVKYLSSADADDYGNIWMVDASQNRLYKFDGSEFTYMDYKTSCLSSIRRLIIDDKNRIWVLGDGIFMLEPDVPLSVNKPFRNDLNIKNDIYPVPASDHITIIQQGNLPEVQSIDIYSISTSKAYQNINFQENNDKIDIAINFLDAGFYLIDVEYADNHHSKYRFIKF